MTQIDAKTVTNTPQNSSSFSIGVLLLDGFNAMALQAFLDPFRSANYLRSQTLYRWSFAGVDGETVTASNGLQVSGLDNTSDAGDRFDLVVVNSSWGPERFARSPVLGWLRNCARNNAALGGLDTGAFVLAYAGVLEGRRAAVHYEHIAAFREVFPDIEMGEDLFVMDRGRLTCCGGLASADLALEIIRLQQGLELANGAGRYIFHERLRRGDEGQLPATREPVGYSVPGKLRDAIIAMERALEQPMSIVDIADRVGLSQRQLERLFHAHTGVSPVRYYVDIRLDRARGLITQTELPILSVAMACGFSNAPQFTRTYKKRFGLTPSRDRIEGRVPFQFRSFPSHAGI